MYWPVAKEMCFKDISIFSSGSQDELWKRAIGGPFQVYYLNFGPVVQEISFQDDTSIYLIGLVKQKNLA